MSYIIRKFKYQVYFTAGSQKIGKKINQFKNSIIKP